MSNLVVRILFAVIAIPVVFFCLWFGDVTRLLLMCFIGGAGAWEWARMVSKMYKGPDMRAVAPVTTVLLTLGWIFQSGKFFGFPAVPGLEGLVLLAVVAAYIAIAYAKVETEHLFPWWLLQIGAPAYLGLWGGLNIFLLGSGHGLEHSYKFILVMTAMWGCDTAAYFVGKFLAGRLCFGRHPLAPTLSPKKTWEGAVGGTLFTIGWVMIFAGPVFGYDAVKGFILGLVLALAGQCGDLLMSALKRWTGTKDASQIFPGHGGVLDRADSFLLAAPMTVLLFDFLEKVL